MELKDATPQQISDELKRRSKADENLIIIFHVGKDGMDNCPAFIAGPEHMLDYAFEVIARIRDGKAPKNVTVHEYKQWQGTNRN